LGAIRAGVITDSPRKIRGAVEQAKLANEQRRERFITKLDA